MHGSRTRRDNAACSLAAHIPTCTPPHLPSSKKKLVVKFNRDLPAVVVKVLILHDCVEGYAQFPVLKRE